MRTSLTFYRGNRIGEVAVDVKDQPHHGKKDKQRADPRDVNLEIYGAYLTFKNLSYYVSITNTH